MADPIQSLYRCVAISHAPNRTRPQEPRYCATCVLIVNGVPVVDRPVQLYSSSPDAFRIDADYLVDWQPTVVAWRPAVEPDATPSDAPPPVIATA